MSRERTGSVRRSSGRGHNPAGLELVVRVAAEAGQDLLDRVGLHDLEGVELVGRERSGLDHHVEHVVQRLPEAVADEDHPQGAREVAEVPVQLALLQVERQLEECPDAAGEEDPRSGELGHDLDPGSEPSVADVDVDLVRVRRLEHHAVGCLHLDAHADDRLAPDVDPRDAEAVLDPLGEAGAVPGEQAVALVPEGRAELAGQVVVLAHDRGHGRLARAAEDAHEGAHAAACRADALGTGLVEDQSGGVETPADLEAVGVGLPGVRRH